MLKENIDDFVFSRIENLPKDAEFRKKYFKAIDEEIELSHKILELLTKENQKLFFDYEDASNKVAFYQTEAMYKQGFKDSFKMFLKLSKE